jgi:sulfur transfer protein SufE
MDEFIEYTIKTINEDIASGLTPVEALEKAGAKKLSGCESLYYIAYGLYEDKVAFFKTPNAKAVQ